MFRNFEELEEHIDEWASKITVHDIYESDFHMRGTATSVQEAIALEHGIKRIYVEPCEMLVVQLTMDWDFTDNWIVYNLFQLDNFGFVDARNMG